jgi:uncharacterized protein (DUF4415 family)
MKTKKEHIARHTLDELKAMEAAGKAKSDWKRAATLPVPDGSDPDDAIEPVRMDWVTATLPMEPYKEKTSLRLDSDVIRWFRSQGKGFQTRINAILRHYYEQHSRR